MWRTPGHTPKPAREHSVDGVLVPEALLAEATLQVLAPHVPLILEDPRQVELHRGVHPPGRGQVPPALCELGGAPELRPARKPHTENRKEVLGSLVSWGGCNNDKGCQLVLQQEVLLQVPIKQLLRCNQS